MQNVPRGTFPRTFRHDFEPHEIEAMAARLKSQFRIRIQPHNSTPPGAWDFHDLELAYGKADTYQRGVAGTLHCRVRDERPHRAIVLRCRANVGDVFFPGHVSTSAEDATDSLLVTEIYAQRLLAISEREARLEGVAASWGIKLATRTRAADEEEVHEALLEAVGDQKLARWRAHEENGDETTARNLFALDQLRRGRDAFYRWRTNPWVWVIGFEWYPLRPYELVKRLASGTLERRRA